MLVPKQYKTVAQVLHNNRVKFPKDLFAIVLSTNMAAVTSDAIKEIQDDAVPQKAKVWPEGFQR